MLPVAPPASPEQLTPGDHSIWRRLEDLHKFRFKTGWPVGYYLDAHRFTRYHIPDKPDLSFQSDKSAPAVDQALHRDSVPGSRYENNPCL